MSKLDPELFQQIRSICEHAGSLVQMGEDEFALSKYYEALTLVPDPKSDHSISTFIYTALGEQYFKAKDYGEAGKCFLKGLKCPGGESIGQINLRIGQCLEECGERKKAQDYLCQAYLLGGEALFAGCSPKYYKIIRSEIEGTLPEDDEVELLHEADEYDIINDILRSGSSKSAEKDYSGYSGAASDKDIGLYSRGGSDLLRGQQRTSVPEEEEEAYDDEWDEDEYFDDDSSYGSGQYEDEYDQEEYDRPEEDELPAERRRGDEDGEPGVWSKIVNAVKGFIELFK